MATPVYSRRGISLLEVLISMGILTIGLVSVLSLVPAGHSQSLKATSLDRSTALALNAAADFINRGFLQPSRWSATPSGSIAVFDPLATSTAWSSVLSGTYSIAPTFATGVPDILVRSEDDILYSTDSVGPDDPPTPVWSNGSTGRHVFEGNFSYLAMLSGVSASWNPGDYKTLSIVTFNRRDATAAPVTLTADTTKRVWAVVASTVPSGMSFKDLVKPGAMVLARDTSTTPTLQWKRVLMAADATDPTAPNSWKIGLTCEGGDPDVSNANSSVFVFPGATGSVQLPVRLEGSSIWND